MLVNLTPLKQFFCVKSVKFCVCRGLLWDILTNFSLQLNICLHKCQRNTSLLRKRESKMGTLVKCAKFRNLVSPTNCSWEYLAYWELKVRNEYQLKESISIETNFLQEYQIGKTGTHLYADTFRGGSVFPGFSITWRSTTIWTLWFHLNVHTVFIVPIT